MNSITAKSKNLLLIYPSQLFTPDWGNVAYTNPSLVNLFSYMRQYRNINTQVLDLDIEIGRPRSMKDVPAFRHKATGIIRKYGFDVAGISCTYGMNYLSSVMVAEICRDINPGCTIIAGGIHASAVPADFAYEGSPFDFVIVGEGEEELSRICRDGLKNTGRTRTLVSRAVGLNRIPQPSFKEYKYFRPGENRTVIWSLSRGCPYGCYFCIESAKSLPDYRCLPVKRAVGQMQEMVCSLGIKKIKFVDPCFGVKKEWRRQFLKRLISNRVKVILEFETRIDLLEKEDIELFGKLNLGYLYLGMEHASARMLSLMGKTGNPRAYLERAAKVMRGVNDKDIPNKLLLVFNHPGETKESIGEATRFLASIFSGLKRISTILCPKNYFITPGTKTFMKMAGYKDKYGTIVKFNEWWKEPCFDQLDLATDIVPSRDLYDEPAREFWQKEINDIQGVCDSKRSRDYRAFDLARRVLLG